MTTDSFNRFDNPIDTAEEHCKDTKQDAAGDKSCTANALVQWDKKLNDEYRELKNDLSPEQQQQLKTTELLWIKFRDEEIQNAMHNAKQHPESVNPLENKKAIERDRALELSERKDDLKNGPDPELEQDRRVVTSAYRGTLHQLDTTYAKLMESLPASESIRLEKSQNVWNKYRDSDYVQIDSLNITDIQKVDKKFSIVNARLLELQDYPTQTSK